MAITRLFQSGFETGDWAQEFDGSTYTPTTQGTVVRTGNYAVQFSGATRFWKDLAATTQFRIGFHFRHNGPAFGSPMIVGLFNGTTRILHVAYNSGGSLDLIQGSSTVLASSSLGDLVNTNTWMHCGVDMKFDAVNGWFNFYLDGTLLLSYTGDTTGAGASASRVQFGNHGSVSHQWNSYAYIDDVYIDDSTGESAAAQLDDLRFVPLFPTGDVITNWTPLTGPTNYTEVDEKPADEDTSYVQAAAASLDDIYSQGGYTAPAHSSVQAVIVHVRAKKSSAGVASQVVPLISDGVNTLAGSAQDPGTDYGPKWERFTTQPDGVSAWDDSAVNALRFGIRSAGSF